MRYYDVGLNIFTLRASILSSPRRLNQYRPRLA
jgi:hypothetical protein